ncbi:hypothetical protein P3T39_000102 [Kitasatospora sp. GP82]|nr:hypothetical protein [Kitasatospora sp. GP82]
MPATAPPTGSASSRVTVCDHAIIGLLALAGFALSYDALRQTAEAIQVRGPLTYVFPLIIDGFITYGVRALLVLRTAPFTARAYVWGLFLASTAASVWANILHAVRLNDQSPIGLGLHLGDTPVGALSMIAPLALAGSVHLGIIVSRHTASRTEWEPATRTATADRSPSVETTEAAAQPDDHDADRILPADREAEPGPEPEPVGGDDQAEPSAFADAPRADRELIAPRKRTGRPPAASMDELLRVARPAVAQHGVTVAVVQKATREACLPISSARFTELMNRLRAEQTGPQNEKADREQAASCESSRSVDGRMCAGSTDTTDAADSVPAVQSVQPAIRRFTGDKRTERVGPLRFTPEERIRLQVATAANDYWGESGFAADVVLAFVDGQFFIDLPLAEERRHTHVFRAQVLRALNGIGHNINQIARALNGGYQPPADSRQKIEEA